MSKLNEKPNGGKVYLRYLHDLCGIYHNPWPSYIIYTEDDGGFTCGSTVMIILLTYRKEAQCHGVIFRYANKPVRQPSPN